MWIEAWLLFALAGAVPSAAAAYVSAVCLEPRAERHRGGLLGAHRRITAVAAILGAGLAIVSLPILGWLGAIACGTGAIVGAVGSARARSDAGLVDEPDAQIAWLRRLAVGLAVLTLIALPRWAEARQMLACPRPLGAALVAGGALVAVAVLRLVELARARAIDPDDRDRPRAYVAWRAHRAALLVAGAVVGAHALLQIKEVASTLGVLVCGAVYDDGHRDPLRDELDDLTAACGAGEARACHAAATLVFSRADPSAFDELVPSFERACERVPAACRARGLVALRETPDSLTSARAWLGRACGQGDGDACTDLDILREGEGLAPIFSILCVAGGAFNCLRVVRAVAERAPAARRRGCRVGAYELCDVIADGPR